MITMPNKPNIIEQLYSSMEFNEDFDCKNMHKELLSLIENADKNQKVYLGKDHLEDFDNYDHLSLIFY